VPVRPPADAPGTAPAPPAAGGEASLDRALEAALSERRAAGLLRRRPCLDSAQGVAPRVDGHACLAFCSNDYLGLAADPRVAGALARAASRWGAGSGASHLVAGHLRPHAVLEEALAEWCGRERALLFSTGYMANLAVAATLVGRGDLVLGDRLNHASLLDAAALSGARQRRFRHADAAHLARLLRGDARRKLVLTDGVFSMDGDLAPLPALCAAARQGGAWVAVDDAHGLGVVGARGRGVLEHFGLDAGAVPVLVGTLGKAFGTFGAFVAGSAALVESLLQWGRTYIYTTALPPAVAAATREALRIAEVEPWRREHLAALVARFRAGATALGLPLADSPTPVQPLLAGSAGRALAWAQSLREQGILVPAIRPPTVPRGGARLRVTFSATHTAGQVDRLLDALALAARDAP